MSLKEDFQRAIAQSQQGKASGGGITRKEPWSQLDNAELADAMDAYKDKYAIMYSYRDKEKTNLAFKSYFRMDSRFTRLTIARSKNGWAVIENNDDAELIPVDSLQQALETNTKVDYPYAQRFFVVEIVDKKPERSR